MTRTSTSALAVILLLGGACCSSTDVPKSTPSARLAPEAVLPALEEQGKVIFSGRFGGSIDGWGVIVLDATSAHAVPAMLGPAMSSLGECWIDPWLSTKSLEGLRALRRGH
jgi:hypothetical protein